MARTQILKGTDGRITFGGTALHLERYRISITADDIPALGFEDVSITAAYDIGDTGVITTVLSASGFWSAGNNPHASPPGIVGGAIISSAKFFLKKDGSRLFTFTEIRILQVEINNELRSRVDFAFTAKSNGAFTYAGGT